MDKEKIIEILEDYEFFVDDDFGGHYEHIDCFQRARIPLGILEILDYISNLEQQVKKQKELIDKARQCIKDFLCSEEYINVDGDAIANNYENILDILKGEDKEVSE